MRPEMSRRLFFPVLLSALGFGLSTPLAKLLLRDIAPISMAGLLYIGAFAGLALYTGARLAFARGGGAGQERRFEPIRARDLPWLAGAILSGGIVGPIFLMEGLRRMSGASASLLLNLEGLATALISVLLFREPASRRTWAALGAMTAAGVLTTWDPAGGRFETLGPLFILIAMAGWGLDNNLTRNISDKDPVLIAAIKGFVAGGITLGLAAAAGERTPAGFPAAAALAVGAVCYGFSLVLFIVSLRRLGAFRTGAFFSFAPFVGAALALPVLGEPVRWTLAPAAGLMVLGVVLMIGEKHDHAHKHVRLKHSHSHVHNDLHHGHIHPGMTDMPHFHEHEHTETEHTHGHWPDGHHRHDHGGG
jgi:drug/metabolite transporter (DMT)-like permease